MLGNQTVASRPIESILSTNKVIRNTYQLLSMTLVFSAFMAYLSIQMQASQMMGLGATVVGIVMMMFVLPKTANSAKGIPVIFIVTGLLGFGVGPMVAYYLAVNPSIVMTALGGTGVIFLGLSGYALTTRKDFSFMGGFLMVGMLVIIGGSILNIFLNIPALQLTISAGVIMVMSGFILYQTSSIINGGEKNYIMATASLFLSLLNMFTALLHILGVMGGDD